MGRDKALVELAGRPMVMYALKTLGSVGLGPSIAGARSDLTAYAPVIADAAPDRGPLQGICTALEKTLRQRGAQWALFVSVDQPLLPASLLASVSGFAQTFPALIRQDLLPALQVEAKAEGMGCFAAFRAAAQRRGETMSVLAVEMLVQTGHVSHPMGLPAAQWFMNVNTPEELDRAAALIQQSEANALI
jgi:molybdopterin-guanine dinucleotide biosynthesis protein A